MPQSASATRTSAPAAHDDSAALLRACAAGDHAAFQALYKGWGGRLHGIALRITRQPALAADATHDAFVQVWQQANQFDPQRGGPEAFLISRVRYRALDIVRRRGRERVGYEPPEQEDDSPDALSRLVANSEGAALHRCLGQLEPDRRKLLTMAFVQGLSHGELAERLCLPLGTVKSWIRRSLLSLRACLAP
jgi:RNA polymerase sigma-70 factor, ECF subfamily